MFSTDKSQGNIYGQKFKFFVQKCSQEQAHALFTDKIHIELNLKPNTQNHRIHTNDPANIPSVFIPKFYLKIMITGGKQTCTLSHKTTLTMEIIINNQIVDVQEHYG